MAFQLYELHFSASLILYLSVTVCALGHNLLGCEETSPDAPGHRSSPEETQVSCQTFVFLRVNQYYSSLSNLSYYFSLDASVVAEANGLFAGDTESLAEKLLVLIPVSCRCTGSFCWADVNRTASKGESFHSVSESLEGLTTCKAIKEKNPGVSPWNLDEQVKLIVPLRCGCPPSSSDASLWVSYPVNRGEKVSDVAMKFSATQEAILSANMRSSSTLKTEKLQSLTSLLIPLQKPVSHLSAKVRHHPPAPPGNITVPTKHKHKKKRRISKGKLYAAVICLVSLASLAVGLVLFLVCFKKKKMQNLITEKDVERQQLSLSVRTTSDKKVSFEGSQDALESQTTADRTPRKFLLEAYTLEELKKATEDFNPSNHIDGAVYFGLLKGKNLAIKRITKDTTEKIDFFLLNDPRHFHPNIIRLLGTCFPDDETDGFLILEFAKNGSLRDWLHGGLAVKNQFISSCYCFLNWDQRLKICLDVAMALNYMHHAMKPSYVHRNIRARNVFLDEEFNAKVGNFGMSNCTEEDENDPDRNPSRVHLAPEYANQGVISPSVDIFAYGVVLVEVLTGEPPSVAMLEKLNKLVSEPDESEEFREWIDEALSDNYTLDSAMAVASLARDCVKEEPGFRPSASDIIERLSKLLGDEEKEQEEGLLVCESSIKPLVKADFAASTGL